MPVYAFDPFKIPTQTIVGGLPVADDDGESKPPTLKVVSENPTARTDREIDRARERAKSKLAELAATMLRMLAGSESASYDLTQRMGQLIDAQQELYKLSGNLLSVEDEREALSLPQSDLDSNASDHQYREWQRDRGMERIVQGALRLAAHQVLGEQLHFGGKYSERLIEDGIAAIEHAYKPPIPPKPPTKKEKAERLAAEALLKDLSDQTREPPKRRKPWSSRDSRSYLDPKPDE
jgi:hypothetical protein